MSAKKHVPFIPVPDFEKRLVNIDEVESLKSRTLQADPITGLSSSTVKHTYADIVKKFNVNAPAEVYTPTEEDIARFLKMNPAASFVNNVIREDNPDEKELDLLPHPCTLFHN